MGTEDFTVTGARELETVGHRLKAAGKSGGGLRRELLRNIRRETKPVLTEIPDNAIDTLPEAGGLSEQVASAQYASRTRLTGNSVGVQIRATGTPGARNLGRLNRGQLRHPLFGDRGRWFSQSVRPGFFSAPIEKRKPRIQRGIKRAMDDTAAKIAKGI